MIYFFIIVVAIFILFKLNSYLTNVGSDDRVKIAINLDPKGRPELTIKDFSGRQITNASVIRKVKQTERYKQEVESLIQNRKKEIEEEKEKKRLQKIEEKKALKNNISEVTSKLNNN